MNAKEWLIRFVLGHMFLSSALTDLPLDRSELVSLMLDDLLVHMPLI